MARSAVHAAIFSKRKFDSRLFLGGQLPLNLNRGRAEVLHRSAVQGSVVTAQASLLFRGQQVHVLIVADGTLFLVWLAVGTKHPVRVFVFGRSQRGGRAKQTDRQ
jgi:hypothetical protein